MDKIIRRATRRGQGSRGARSLLHSGNIFVDLERLGVRAAHLLPRWLTALYPQKMVEFIEQLFKERPCFT
jgi:cysteinyl-tRNA synthetase